MSALPCQTQSPAGPCVRSLAYQCGDEARGFSPVMHVQVHHSSIPSAPGPQFAIVGDMGVPHGLRTIDSIAARIANPAPGKPAAGVTMLLHVGDIAYADVYNKTTPWLNSQVWVDYMNSLQSVVARVPYMTAPGNHEKQFHFAAYTNWLPMPHEASNSTSPFWFSFDYLGVHVLSFSTEHRLDLSLIHISEPTRR